MPTEFLHDLQGHWSLYKCTRLTLSDEGVVDKTMLDETVVDKLLQVEVEVWFIEERFH